MSRITKSGTVVHRWTDSDSRAWTEVCVCGVERIRVKNESGVTKMNARARVIRYRVPPSEVLLSNVPPCTRPT